MSLEIELKSVTKPKILHLFSPKTQIFLIYFLCFSIYCLILNVRFILVKIIPTLTINQEYRLKKGDPLIL